MRENSYWTVSEAPDAGSFFKAPFNAFSGVIIIFNVIYFLNGAGMGYRIVIYSIALLSLIKLSGCSNKGVEGDCLNILHYPAGDLQEGYFG